MYGALQCAVGAAMFWHFRFMDEGGRFGTQIAETVESTPMTVDFQAKYARLGLNVSIALGIVASTHPLVNSSNIVSISQIVIEFPRTFVSYNG